MSDRDNAEPSVTPASSGDGPPPSTYPTPPVPSTAPSAYPAPPVGGYSAAAPPGYTAPPEYPASPYPYPAPAYAPSTYPGAPPEYAGHPGGWPPPGPPPTRARLGLIIGVVAAVVVLLAGGFTIALLVVATNSPRASLEGWFEAARSGDITELRSLTCAQYAEVEFDPGLLAGIMWEIHDIKQVDETLAEATLTVRTAGDESTERWAIVKEDGLWKVCGPVEQLDRAQSEVAVMRSV